MSKALAVITVLSRALTATIATLRVIEDVVQELEEMQREGRDPTEREWQRLEAKAAQADARLAQAIREARLEVQDEHQGS